MYEEKTKEVAQIFACSDGRIIEKWFADTYPLVANMYRYNPTHYFGWLEIIVGFKGTHWELFIQLFRETPQLLQLLTLEQYDQYFQLARSYSRIDVKTAVAFARAGRGNLAMLHREEREKFLSHCRSLFSVDWEGALAYYNSFPLLAGRERAGQGDYWNQLSFSLAKEAPSLLKEFLQGAAVLQHSLSSEELEKWLEAGLELGKKVSSKVGAQFLKDFTRLAPLCPVGEKDVLEAWTAQVMELSSLDTEALTSFMHNSPLALEKLGSAHMCRWWQPGLEVTKKMGKAGDAYYGASLNVVSETGIDDMEKWVQIGLQLDDERRLKLYFARQSRESQEALKSQQRTLFLEKELKNLLTLAEASFELPSLIRDRTVLPREFYERQPLLSFSDGYRVYLPDKINAFPEQHHNFKLYKLMLFHQLAHLSLGAYALWKELEQTGMKQIGHGAEPELYRQVLQAFLGKRADLYLLKVSPGLKRDFQLLLPHFLQKLSSLERGIPAEKAFHTMLTQSLPYPATGVETFPLVIDGEELSRQVVHTYEKLLQQAPAKDFLKLFKTYPVPYRGAVFPELLEAAELVRTHWEEHGERISAEKLIAQTGNRFFVGKDVKFYRHLLVRLIALHRQEGDEGFSQVAFYDEWDWTLEDYKQDWCRVRESMLQPVLNNSVDAILEEYYSLVTLMKRYFAMLRPDRVKKLKRQPEGEDLDLDAIVETMVEKKVGLAEASNLYIRRDKRKRDVAVAFLLDCSGSTDEVITGDKTILDLEKEAVVIMAESLEMLGDYFAVYAFSSNGRKEVDFHVIKDFEEVYSPEVRSRFGRLQSANMTRLAAAVRHALIKIQNVRAAVRLLFILSDGRPFDMDYRARENEEKNFSRWLREDESLYPQADTRMALWEAKAAGITPFCITVDKHAKDYMDQIFGRVGYVLINHVDLLPVKLPEIYRRLTT